jgi:hypothetical protein
MAKRREVFVVGRLLDVFDKEIIGVLTHPV